MGDNTLTAISEPATVEVADGNQFFTALVGDFLPRNASTGAIEDNVHKLGRPATRWKEAHITDLFLGGSLFDPDAVGVDTKFAINTGATRTDSNQPDFLRADGTGASATILATATNLQITANNTSITITADIAVTSLTVAPAANNTALVDDTDLAGGSETKYTGENFNDILTIDTVGSEITDRIGEFICLKTPTGEFMFAFVEDATTLNRCYRGFFFDDSGVPVVRGVLSNNDTLTLMSLGWVFLENNGTTVDVSYTSPTYSGVEPPSPVTDDYWFDLKNRLWKRFDGSVFQQVDRMLLGIVVIDGTDCVAARSFDFTKSYKDVIDLEVELGSVTTVKTQKGYSSVHVYGALQELYAGDFVWDITSDLETGLSEASATDYYLYVTEEGIPIIATERPFDRRSELSGYYHPFHTWRYVGMALNDGSSNFTTIRSKNNPFEKRTETFTATGTFIPLPNVNKFHITVVGGGAGGGGADGGGGAPVNGAGGGGGGGGTSIVDITGVEIGITVTIGAGGAGGSNTGGDGSAGGESSFGSRAVAGGGDGGEGSGSAGSADLSLGGDGGVGSSGDINFKGSAGKIGSPGSVSTGGGGGGTYLSGEGNSVIQQTSGTTAGIAGNNFGGGGSGGADVGQASGVTGGTGAAGTVIIEY